MIIAIDGPAASGKGTLARRLAEHYGLPHLDTGLLYRATAASLLDADRDLRDVDAAVAAARGLSLTEFDEARLRGREMGEAASIVAALPEVRAALIEAQRNFAARPDGAVLDGRDIGTVVCPRADVKIFVTASPAARAQRRALELAQRGESVDYGAILADIARRDARDSGRADAPLRAAPDAALLDTTGMSVEAAFAQALRIVESRQAPRLRRAGDARQAFARRLEAGDRVVDLAPLPLEMIDLIDDLRRPQPLFEAGLGCVVLGADKVPDFGERETELLSLEDHLQANPIGSAVVAPVAHSPRANQVAILVKAQRAQRDAEFARHFADRHLARAARAPASAARGEAAVGVRKPSPMTNSPSWPILSVNAPALRSSRPASARTEANMTHSRRNATRSCASRQYNPDVSAAWRD